MEIRSNEIYEHQSTKFTTDRETDTHTHTTNRSHKNLVDLINHHINYLYNFNYATLDFNNSLKIA